MYTLIRELHCLQFRDELTDRLTWYTPELCTYKPIQILKVTVKSYVLKTSDNSRCDIFLRLWITRHTISDSRVNSISKTKARQALIATLYLYVFAASEDFRERDSTVNCVRFTLQYLWVYRCIVWDSNSGITDTVQYIDIKIIYTSCWPMYCKLVLSLNLWEAYLYWYELLLPIYYDV